ncbi:MAG: hypothetical protein LC130_32760 [Bryobacterales bacterium]|nr:hypothetical protein [Bryobacterales bacterium]MEB2362785.1 hypothetical protein [Bryobacterales bacterium]
MASKLYPASPANATGKPMLACASPVLSGKTATGSSGIETARRKSLA